MLKHFHQNALLPSCIGNPGHKGGNVTFKRLLIDVRTRLRNPTAFCTTLFDFYGLPSDFPGKSDAQKQTTHVNKARCVTRALSELLTPQLGQDMLRRFIPYVQMCEFEGLLFSQPGRFASGIKRSDLAADLYRIRNSFTSPEEINDSPQTGPSKRILAIYPGYDKRAHGSLAASEIGLKTIRLECPLFDGWLKSIESLVTQASLQSALVI